MNHQKTDKSAPPFHRQGGRRSAIPCQEKAWVPTYTGLQTIKPKTQQSGKQDAKPHRKYPNKTKNIISTKKLKQPNNLLTNRLQQHQTQPATNDEHGINDTSRKPDQAPKSIQPSWRLGAEREQNIHTEQ
jgi:hypothetical protein